MKGTISKYGVRLFLEFRVSQKENDINESLYVGKLPVDVRVPSPARICRPLLDQSMHAAWMGEGETSWSFARDGTVVVFT